MKNLLRAYRPKARTVAMTEQEVHDMVQACPNYMIGDLAGRRPPFYTGFAGTELTLKYDNGAPTLRHRFLDGHRLLWSDGGDEHEEYYEALQIDEKVFLLAYLRRGTRPAESMSIVLDFDRNLTTCILARMGNEYAAREVSQFLWFGVIEREGVPTPLIWRHHHTRDLVGRSMGWSYRDDMTSQHIYGTPHSIAWVILTGPGAGLLGSAPAQYVKISDHVYLLTWVETQGSGQQGVVLMNLNTMHDVGTFYGIHHGQQFEFYTYGARAYNLGRFETQDLFTL